MTPDAPVIVVGAGAVGLCAAFYLSKAGLDVRVVERNTVGAGASRGNAGWVCLSHSAPVPAPGVAWRAARSIGRPDSPLYLRPRLTPSFLAWLVRFQRSTTRSAFERGYAALARLSVPTFDRFAELADAGVDTTLRRPGLLHVFRSAAEARRYQRLQGRMSWAGYEVPDDLLVGASLAALEPALRGDVGAGVGVGYLVPGDGLVDPFTFTSSLAGILRKQSVCVDERTSVIGVRLDGASVTAVVTNRGDLPCSAVVVAAGSWSASLVAMLGGRLSLQSGKGYSFSVDLPTPPRHPMFLGDKNVAVSPIGGTTRIAGTMELSGNNRNLDWRRITAIAHASRDYLGRWYDTPDDLMSLIRDPWVAGRPMLPDGLPTIDRLPLTRNAFVSTGHGMLGITLAPASGSAVGEFVRTGERPAVLEPFRVDR